MKATIFALNGQVTAIAFQGEPMNFNGVAVKEIEVDQDKLADALAELAPSGVGSPWPPAGEAPVEAPKPTKKK